MLAYTGYWSTSHHLAEARKRETERVARLKALRKAHRAKPAWQRLLDDLDEVHAKLKQSERAKPYNEARSRRLLRQWNRLSDALKRLEEKS